MGIGDYPCGSGPCGFDPVSAISARNTEVAAIPYYDPSIRGFALQTNGDLKTVHPVIQEASFALGIALGSIPAAPKVGLNVKRIKATRPADILTVCKDEVNVALARLLEAGDIRVNDVRAEARWGRVGLEVDIVNLRDQSTTTLTGVL